MFRSLLTILVVVGFSASASAQKLVFRGSDTLGDRMVPELAAAYAAAGHEVEFDIVAKGSSEAFTALKDGSAEIGMSSRSDQGRGKRGAEGSRS